MNHMLMQKYFKIHDTIKTKDILITVRVHRLTECRVREESQGLQEFEVGFTVVSKHSSAMTSCSPEAR